ncbi:class I SAM-dependent methyltransferase [Paraconexibacter sp.]|uniref:class I SAM-dependent methyltransferase n=1 Tax=Paraconexibacter sp. TaxID=2949640 RepID=UPI00356521D0
MADPPTDEILQDLKQRARQTWAAGHFDAVVDHILPAGEDVVRAAGITDGQTVLDIACGSGNATVPAALTGATVTGLDLTPELFDDARRRGAAAGVRFELVEGDAEALPFPDESFDVVISTFGIMFAPRHAVAAAEVVRVLRPGGRFALACWTPDGYVGDMFRTVGGFLPAPPDFVQPPPLWGDPSHVRELFADHPVELDLASRAITWRFESAADYVEEFAADFGPLVMARAALEPQDRWGALIAALTDVVVRRSTPADDGAMHLDGAYLLTTGRKI